MMWSSFISFSRFNWMTPPPSLCLLEVAVADAVGEQKYRIHYGVLRTSSPWQRQGSHRVQGTLRYMAFSGVRTQNGGAFMYLCP